MRNTNTLALPIAIWFVLLEADDPMTVDEIIDAMAKRGFWRTHNGRTNGRVAKTIDREIRERGSNAKYRRVDGGKYTWLKPAAG